MEKTRLKYLDVLRVLAVFLVAWGYLVGTGTNALEIPELFHSPLQSVIIPPETHPLWKLEAFLFYQLHTQPAVLGVLLFFAITGYVTAAQLERYRPRDFLINRIFRIFPVLICCVGLVGITAYALQGIQYSAANYLVSMFLLFSWTLIPATMGVLWFLVVQVVFYVLCACIRRLSLERIFFLYSLIFVSFVLVKKIDIPQLYNLADYLKYISFILIGSTVYLAEKSENWKKSAVLIIGSILLSFSAFRGFRQYFGDDSTYPNIASFAIVLCLFFGGKLLNWKRPRIFEKIPVVFFAFSKISYAYYLLHFSMGIYTMYYLRLAGVNSYLALLAGFIAPGVPAYLVTVWIEKPCASLGNSLIQKLNAVKTSQEEHNSIDNVNVQELTKAEGQPIVEVDNVSMMFNLSTERVDSFKEYLIRFLKHRLFFNEFWALREVTFQIKKRESLAIIGLNGSGKSTLLKLISGVLKPTSGSLTVHGNIAPLLELGAGFDMDLSARENIYLNGTVLGYSKKEIDQKFQSIVDFAELHEFLDVPIKNFSSGMLARLGFAIATDVEPDLLILDEVLSVGDYRFQEKCEQRIMEMVNHGATVIFVSHSVSQVKKICKKAVWLEQGRVKMLGDVEEICMAYEGK